MQVSFHRLVQADLNQILDKYDVISDRLGSDFFAEFQAGVLKVSENPAACHFDASGLRRYNLDRFPYHFLYDIRGELARVWVLRHDRRHPGVGLRRFSR